MRYSSQKCTKIKPEWKKDKTINQHQDKKKKKATNPSKNRKKQFPKTPKGPGFVEDTKAKMQISIEKGDSFPKVEGASIDPVKNGFQMTDQEPV